MPRWRFEAKVVVAKAVAAKAVAVKAVVADAVVSVAVPRANNSRLSRTIWYRQFIAARSRPGVDGPLFC